MAYNKHVWKNGDDVTVTRLNNIENGIDQAINGVDTKFDGVSIRTGRFVVSQDDFSQEVATSSWQATYVLNITSSPFKNQPQFFFTFEGSGANKFGVSVSSRTKSSATLKIRRTDGKYQATIEWLAIGT